MDRLGMEPWKESLPDCLQGWDRLGLCDVDHAEIFETQFRLPLHDHQSMSWGFDFRYNSHSTPRTLPLDVVKLTPRVRLVGTLVETCNCWIIRSESKCSI